MEGKRKATEAELQAVCEKYISSDEEEDVSRRMYGDEEYEIERILDEVVTMTGTHKYLVQWKGSSISWVRRKQLIPGAEGALEDWETDKQRRILGKRQTYAQTGVPISLFGGVGIARYNTILQELGLGTSRLLTSDVMVPPSIDTKNIRGWEEELEAVKAEAERSLAEMATARPESSMSTSSSGPELESFAPPKHQRPKYSKNWIDSASSDFQTSSGSRAGSTHTPDRELSKKSPQKLKTPRIQREASEEHARREARKQTPQKTPVLGNRHSVSGSLKRPLTSVVTEDSPTKRKNTGKAKERITERTLLQEKWNHIIQEADAAPLIIVNEVDDELIPPSVDLDTFVYIESGAYVWDGDGPTHDGFFVGCDGDCEDPRECQCQSTEFAEEIIIKGRRSFAYDSMGRYRLPDGSRIAVFECNQVCRCDLTCPNRVSQRPRDIPMEVFKTKKKGWGVRATTFIPKGKVLGVFTGALIDSSADDGWCYALDWFEQDFRWRVSSKHCGNWSRFLNHSCFPNIKVYAVIFDSVPDAGEDHRHRLAFVAIKDIEARTELVIDYSPQTEHGESRDNCCEFGGCKAN